MRARTAGCLVLLAIATATGAQAVLPSASRYYLVVGRAGGCLGP